MKKKILKIWRKYWEIFEWVSVNYYTGEESLSGVGFLVGIIMFPLFFPIYFILHY